MAKEKKPSIYSDRGKIGSSEELDEYGVWVKSEPQDFSSEEAETPELDAELSGDEDADFTVPEMEGLPDLDPFDEKTTDDLSIAALPTEDFAIPDIGSDSETETEDKPELSEESGADLDFGDLTAETGFESLDIPDIEEPSGSGGLDNSVGLAGIEESGPEDDFEIPEIDEQSQEDVTLDTGPTGTESGDDIAGLSIDNSLNDLIENFDVGEDELPDISIELDSGPVDEEYAPSAAPVQTELKQETGFSTETSIPKNSGLTAASSTQDLSTQLLMKIAEELSSIRVELGNLKKEFSGIRVAAPPAETEEGGFFDKEDDEKIALTGDELNNILNTADFTEETGTDVTMGLTEDDAGVPDSLPGLDMETGADSKDLDMGIVTDGAGLDLPEAIDLPEETAPDLTAGETEEKASEPITHDLTTEDTNYLAKAPAEAGEAIDLPEAAVDDSDITLDDISSEIQVDQIDEPLPDDLSVNLDIEEKIPEDTGSENLGAIDSTSEDLGAIDIPSDELGSLDIPSDELASVNITTDELGGADITSDDLASVDIPSDELGGADITSDELTSVAIPSDELGDIDIASDDLTSIDIPSDELGDIGIASDDLTGIDIPSDELGGIDITSDELGDIDITSDEFANVGITAEEPVIEDLSTEKIAAEEPGAESAGTEELSTDDLSILELGVEDFDTVEPVIEEAVPEPVKEEPVLEEDFGILAADEKQEEDFGILVVDEPSGGILEEAEELHEEAAAKEDVAAEAKEISGIPRHLKHELKTVLSYMDQLLEALPDEKIEEFARSEYYDTYKKLFKELGIA
jgi:hypothetical protein